MDGMFLMCFWRIQFLPSVQNVLKAENRFALGLPNILSVVVSGSENSALVYVLKAGKLLSLEGR